MDQDALERARRRLAAVGESRVDPAAVESALDRTREQLESFVETAAELESTMPERVGTALHEALRTEVLPVARHIAEVRGLTGQTIRRLERLQADLDSERAARVEDLALLVELISSGWHGVERRLDRLERIMDRVERALEDRPVASVYRIEDRKPG
jgi:hypothetical protein